MASRLVDQFGYPVHSGGGGRLIEATRRDNTQSPQEPTRMEAITRAVNYWDWKTMVSASRRLWANFDVLKGATALKAMHSVGRAWAPVFLGEDKEWGEKAAKWLEDEWFKLCDVRGPIYDFRTGLHLDSISIDRDGDNALLLTETDSGYPQIQRLACHRIGQLGGTSSAVVGDEAVSVVAADNGEITTVRGLYKGLRIELGTIYNDAGRAVAHRVIDQFGLNPQDISARDMDLRYDPEYVDQGRGFPAFSGSINFLASSFTSHQYEQQALLLAGAIGLIITNETGGADMGDPSTADQPKAAAGAAPGTPTFETMRGGLLQYIKAGGNEKIEAFRNAARPGAEWDSFNDRIIRVGLLGCGVPYSLVWKPEGMNGTQERSAIAVMRKSVEDRQDLLLPRACRMCGYAASKAVKLGILDPYPGNDRGGFLRWGFEYPALFSIDQNKDGAQWLALRNAGAATLQSFLDQNQMGSVMSHYLRLANEDADRQEAIATVEKKRSVTIDPRNIRMITPNDQPTPDPSDESQNPPAKTAPPTEEAA